MNRINKQMVDSTLSEKEVEKIAEETAKALGSKFSVTKGSIDNRSFSLDYDGVKYDGGSYLIMYNGDIVNVAIMKAPIYYNYKTKKKYEFGGNFQAGVYNKGGSLEAHGIKEGDTFIRTISGAIQKVRDKDGKIVYINLANGERDSQPPLPFNDGGEVTYYVNKDGIRVRSKVEPKEKLSEKEWMAKHSQSKEARAYKRGGALIGNQKRIDMNHNGEIDAEDFKLLRSSMNGAWRNERKHVNHKEDYEVRYARPRPSRTGYKGKRNFETKSVVPKSQKAESGAVVKKKSGNPKMKEAMVLAKKIRKDGEKWTDAVKRAYAQIK
jgi:hypothetical protein